VLAHRLPQHVIQGAPIFGSNMLEEPDDVGRESHLRCFDTKERRDDDFCILPSASKIATGVENAIKGYASSNVLTDIGAGSPNLLLYSHTRKTAGMLLMKSLPWIALTVAVLAPVMLPAQAADHEVLLLPILSEPLPGAFGALWRTDVWFMRKDNFVSIAPLVDRNCLPPRCGPPPPPLPDAFEAVQPPLYRTRPGEPPGVLLYVTKDAVRRIALNVRVVDTSRQDLAEGVAIPVVTANELAESVHLLNVVVTPESRVMLRVYDPFAADLSAVTVRIYTIELADRLVAEQDVVLRRAPADAVQNWSLPIVPASAEFPLQLPQLPAGRTHLRLEVSPVTAGLRLWAFASVTNNTTNEVTLVTP
jgi:hypothetical protein